MGSSATVGHLPSGDVVVFREDAPGSIELTEETMKAALEAGAALVCVLGPRDSVEVLDAEAMREGGWVRLEAVRAAWKDLETALHANEPDPKAYRAGAAKALLAFREFLS